MRDFWEGIKERLKSRISEASYKIWIAPLMYDRVEGDTLVIKCPNQFFGTYVQEHYLPYIRQDLLSGPSPLKIRLEPVEKIRSSARGQLHLPKFSPTEIAHPRFCDRYTFEEFVVGESNRFAYAACWAAANEEPQASRVIYLHARSGLGKSHLTQAVGRRFKEREPEKKLCYMTANDFTQQMVSAIKNSSLEQFKERFLKCCDVLLIEQVNCLAGRERTQAELALALDPLMDMGKTIVFTANDLPRRIPKLSDALRSRLSSGMLVSINPPDYETRKRIVARKARNQGVELSADTIEYLAQYLTGDIRRIESAVIGLIAKSSLLKRPISLDLAREVIHELVGDPGPLTISAITDLVCSHFNITAQQIRSRSRRRAVALPRQIAMYFARKHTDSSLESIGKEFNRDHATVIHSIKKIERQLKESPKFRNQLKYLMDQLEKQKWRSGTR